MSSSAQELAAVLAQRRRKLLEVMARQALMRLLLDSQQRAGPVELAAGLALARRPALVVLVLVLAMLQAASAARAAAGQRSGMTAQLARPKAVLAARAAGEAQQTQPRPTEARGATALPLALAAALWAQRAAPLGLPVRGQEPGRAAAAAAMRVTRQAVQRQAITP